MKLTTAAFGLGAVLFATPLAAQMPSRTGQDEKPAPAVPEKASDIKPSSGARKALFELQTAVNANDVANIPAKVAAAQAVATSKEDKYLIGQMQLKAALAAKDNAAMAAAIDVIAGSGYLDASKSAELYGSLGGSLYNSKQFTQAAAAFEKASQLDPRNADFQINLGESRFAVGQKAEAVKAMQRAIQLKTAAGQKPEEALYKRMVTIAYAAELPAAAELGREWVAAYPSVDSWHNSIAIYRNLSKPDVEGTLDLLRLMQASGSLSSAADYNLFATAAADQLNYNEAQAVIDQGIAAKVVDPTNPMFRDTVVGLKSKPKATAADLEAAAKSAVNGMALLRIGDRYYGMGNYAKAVELYRQSMGKAGVDANVANLHIGMALARSGDKAGASAALNAVTGPRAEIAKYWLLYVQSHA
jgi:tetratricopeptide (TPR) repeat protein